MDGAFQPFEQIDAHKPEYAEFAPYLGEVAVFVRLLVFIGPAGKYVIRRGVDRKRQRAQLIVYLAVVYRVFRGGEARAEGPLDVEDVALELLDRPERRCVQAAPRPYSGSARRTRRRGCGG